MTITHTITTFAEIVAVTGGPEALARRLRVRTADILQWLDDDDVPPGWHFRLYVLARRRGCEVALRVFGMAEDWGLD